MKKIKLWFYHTWLGRKLFKMDAVPNPLAIPDLRNSICLCGSGKKIKKCCGRHRYVSRKWAEQVVKSIRQQIVARANGN